MKRTLTIVAIFCLIQSIAFGQKKYEMVIEKTDGTETVINVEDIVRTYFRERSEISIPSYLTCPDTNHPHMIDLGLPSGTKWACCNVGASKPEDYGEYYAWGEIQTKDLYNTETYLYASSWDDFVNIGSDIAGSGYDAATANWGASWRMPTFEQFKELEKNCTSEWTTQNGINGRTFKGPNGGIIFLPAGGDYWDIVKQEGNRGDYWSSSADHSKPDYAYFATFSKENTILLTLDGSWKRVSGKSIRPVGSK